MSWLLSKKGKSLELIVHISWLLICLLKVTVEKYTQTGASGLCFKKILEIILRVAFLFIYIRNTVWANLQLLCKYCTLQKSVLF